MPAETYTVATIIGMLLAALGWLMKTHKEQIIEERRRTAEEKQRADRLMEIVMRAVGASEELISVAKSRGDAREK